MATALQRAIKEIIMAKNKNAQVKTNVNDNAAIEKVTPKSEFADQQKFCVSLVNKYGTKAMAIRELTAQGWKVKEIYKPMGISYQHVNNTVRRVLKREPTI